MIVWKYGLGTGTPDSLVREGGAVNDTGKPYDVATSLYGYRDYAPALARFTTEDPIRDNWFVYVNNDPWADWTKCICIGYWTEDSDSLAKDVTDRLGTGNIVQVKSINGMVESYSTLTKDNKGNWQQCGR